MAKLNDKMFNRVIEGRLYSDKGFPLDMLFDNVVFDESANTTEVGGNLYVDGVLSVSDDCYLQYVDIYDGLGVEGTLSLNGRDLTGNAIHLYKATFENGDIYVTSLLNPYEIDLQGLPRNFEQQKRFFSTFLNAYNEQNYKVFMFVTANQGLTYSYLYQDGGIENNSNSEDLLGAFESIVEVE